MKKLLILCVGFLLLSCNGMAQKEIKKTYKIDKTDAEWKAELWSLLHGLQYQKLCPAMTKIFEKPTLVQPP